MAWIIWIVAAPGVISQGCSPLGGALTRKMGSWFSRELLALRQGESQGWRVRTGGHLRTGAQAESPGTSVTQVSVFGQGWLCAQGHPVLVQGRMEQPSTLGAVFCPYCWLVTWDLIPAPFDISFPKEILLFSLLLYIFFCCCSSSPDTFGHHCCSWQLPVAALNATGCEGMFTSPQLHCLWTVLNLTLIKHANNKRGSVFFLFFFSFFMNVTCLSWKDMLLILAFHLNQESNTKQKSI